MSWTKRQFVHAAFEEIGLANYDFDLQPEQMDSAVRKLDAMMAQWNASGIQTGYSISQNPDLDQRTRVPDGANEAIYLALAIRLAGSVGKVVSMDLKQNAKQAKDALLRSLVHVHQVRLPTSLPLGAGNKCRRHFVFPVQDNVVSEPEPSLEFINGL